MGAAGRQVSQQTLRSGIQGAFGAHLIMLVQAALDTPW
jgi:hypothetical protein